MRLLAGAHTDVGTRKTINQDAYGLRVVENGPWQMAFAVVCDGVGGMAEGEVASGVAVRAFLEWFESHMAELFLDLPSEGEIFEQWRRTAGLANTCIYEYGQEKGVHIGTTATVLLMVRDEAFAMNIGDTRLYCVERDRLRVVTKDHTLVQQEVEQGLLTQEAAGSDKRRHILTRCLGAQARVVPDFYSGSVRPGSVYLLCTDGFRNAQDPKELLEGLDPLRVEQGRELSALLQDMTGTVKGRGERDNITSVALYFPAGEDPMEQTVDLEDTVDLRLARESIRPEAEKLWMRFSESGRV